MTRSHFLTSALTTKATWGLKVERTGKWLARHAELAGSSKSRRKGLLGQDGLSDGHALVIAPTQGVHTFGMRFDIDVVGVSRDGMVVSIKEALPPWRVMFSWRAFAIVELDAGAAQRVGLELGDKLVAGPDPISRS